MTVAAKVADNSPELLSELRLVAEKYLPHSTIAFRKRVKTVLR